MGNITDFIRGLPKAELHVHIEGTFEPELMLKIAERNRLPAPFPSVETARAAYEFGNLQEFLDLYYRGMNVLLTEQDFYDLTMAYLTRVHADGVRHAEIFFDPQAHTERGVPLATAIDGIWRALQEGERRFAISSRLIPCFLRDLDEASALATFEACLAWRERICGFGLDSAERNNPPEKFARVFARVRDEGFHVVAHAGEEGPAAYVRDSLDVLGAERIDHGISAMGDDPLVERLAREEVVLTVCPLSSVRLRVVPEIGAHPVKRMLDLGLKATINSDDPPYFGGYIADNFLAVQQAYGLSYDDLTSFARNSFEGAFLDDDAKRSLITELDDYVAAHPQG